MKFVRKLVEAVGRYFARRRRIKALRRRREYLYHTK